MVNVIAQEWELSVKSRKFNFDWKFLKGDNPDAFKIQFDDSDWRILDLPHDFSIEGPFKKEYASSTGYLPGGIGWYRKEFIVPDSIKGKKYLFNSMVFIKIVKCGLMNNFLVKDPMDTAHFSMT